MIALIPFRISSINGITSATCNTNSLQILQKFLHSFENKYFKTFYNGANQESKVLFHLEQLYITNLYSDEVTSAFLSYLYKGVTGHVLYSLMHFVHELKQLVYNRLQELPMLAQEPRGEITVSL